MRRALIVTVAMAVAMVGSVDAKKPKTKKEREREEKGKEEVSIPIDEKTGRYSYSEVVQVPDASADELYSRARAWVADAYRSAQDVIQLDDKDSGRLIAKGLVKFAYPKLWGQDLTVRHSVRVEVKEGRYRYTVTDFIAEGDNTFGDYERPLEDKGFTFRKAVLKRHDGRIQGLIAELKNAMLDPTPGADDEW